MKRILLIEDERPFWPRIRDLLAKVNAVVAEVGPGDAIAAAMATRPDLVLIGDARQAALNPGWWDGALLVLEKGRPADLVAPIGPGTHRMAASSSIGEREFLSLTSRLLGVSERRLFRAVIGIRRAGQEHVYMGASREFSLTGLSFSLAVDLKISERILISFFIPGARRRVALEGEVVRDFADPEDGSRCFGARFLGLSTDEQLVLKQFVWAEA